MQYNILHNRAYICISLKALNYLLIHILQKLNISINNLHLVFQDKPFNIFLPSIF